MTIWFFDEKWQKIKLSDRGALSLFLSPFKLIVERIFHKTPVNM